MGEPAKPIAPTSPATDAEDDPVLAAIRRAPFVPATEEEIALMEEAEQLHTHWIPHTEVEESVAAMRPGDVTGE